MDREIKQGVKDIAQAQRLQDEEALHGNNISRTIEYSEEIEEKQYLIKKLQKKIKVTWGIIVAGLIALMIILLYMIYTGLQQEPEPKSVSIKKEPVEVVVTATPIPTQAPEEIVTEVFERGIVFRLNLPEITMEGIDSTTIGDVKAWVDQGSYGEREFQYLDNNYYTGYLLFNMNPSTVLYELEDIKSKLAQLPRTYDIEVLENPQEVLIGRVDSMTPMLYFGCGVCNRGDIESAFLYYNEEYLNYLGAGVLGEEDCIMGHEYTYMNVELYDKDSIPKVEAAIQEVLEGYTYMYSATDYSASLPDEFIDKIYEAIIGVEEKVNIRGGDYHYYQRIDEQGTQLVGIHDGEQEVLKERITLHFTVEELVYNIYGYLYHSGLY